jgi:hypothetical protein
MTDIIETRLNDVPYSATSCSWNIALAPFIGITRLDYSEKRDRKMVHGSRRDGTPLGITAGKYFIENLSITMLRSSFQRLAELLTPLGLGSFGDARFPIIATYSDVSAQLNGVPPITVDIQGCRIVGVKDGYQEGTDELVTDVEMMGLTLTRNGLRLWSVINGVGI